MNTIMLLVYAALVAFVSLRPAGDASIGSWDKVAHLVIYALFAMLAARVARTDPQLAILCTAIVIFSGVLELLQSLVPGRSMSGLDLLANIIGVALGAALARKWLR